MALPKKLKQHPSGIPTQAELDALTVPQLLSLLQRDATREDLLGLWLAIDHQRNLGPDRDVPVLPHDLEDLAAMDDVVAVRDADGSIVVATSESLLGDEPVHTLPPALQEEAKKARVAAGRGAEFEEPEE